MKSHTIVKNSSFQALGSLKKSKNFRAYAGLSAGVTALIVSPLFVWYADAPGIVTSFYRMLITSIVLTPVMFLYMKKHGKQKARDIIFPIIAGVFSSLDHGFWSTAIEKTTVANATFLNYLSPLWVGLFSVIFLKERLGTKFWIGIIAVLGGSAVVLGSTIVIRPSYAVGDLLGIISSIFYAGFFLFTQKGRKHLDAVPQLWIMTATAGVCLFGYTRILDLPLVGYSPDTYLTFLIVALVSQLFGYFCITYALGKLPASIVAPTMVLQPIMTAILAIPIAGQTLLSSQVIGGGVALCGIYLINRSTGPNSQKMKDSEIPGLLTQADN